MHTVSDSVAMVDSVRIYFDFYTNANLNSRVDSLPLGHNETADEWIPRLIKYMNVTVTGGAVRAYCGSTFSIVISGHNNPYFFGKNSRRMGEIHPKIVFDLCGKCNK